MDHVGKEKEIADELGIPPAHVCIVGSTLICGKGNDIDALCLVPSEDILVDHEYHPDVETQYESVLHSYRKGDVNVIAVTDARFFFAELAIANAAAAVNKFGFDFNNRDARILFHQWVRDAVLSRISEDTF